VIHDGALASYKGYGVQSHMKNGVAPVVRHEKGQNELT
jgi:hypothetical protein